MNDMNRRPLRNFGTFKRRILKMAIIVMLATTWLFCLAASVRQVNEGRSEKMLAHSSAAGSAMLFSRAGIAARSFQNADRTTSSQGGGFLEASCRLGTVLAVAAMVIPFGLSTLSILIMKRAQELAVRRPITVPVRIRLGEPATTSPGIRSFRQDADFEIRAAPAA
jgi:hypothetical protein